MHYRDFDLKLFGDTKKGYFVELINSPLSTRSEPQPLLLPENEIAAWSDEVKNGEADRQTSKAFGMALFHALFPLPIRDIWMRSYAPMSARSRLRLRLDIRSAALAVIPWEIIHDGEHHLAMAPATPVIRYLFDQPAVDSVDSTQPLNILLAVASPSDKETLNATEYELDFINDDLQDLIEAGRVRQPFVLRRATLDRLQRTLLDGYQILHFMGHGEFQEETGYLVLEDERGASHCVDGETFSYFLLGGDLSLLVLNACETANPSQLDPMLGVAHAALVAGVPAVVAMQGPIYDDNAAVFARAFYRSLAVGKPLENCMIEGRRAVLARTSFDHSDWAVPVLFSNSRGGVLWQSPDTSPVPLSPDYPSPPLQSSGVARGSRRKAETQTVESRRPAVLHNLTSADYATFLNREEEFRSIMDVLHPKQRVAVINIFGIGGVGRTALAHEVAERCLEFSQEQPEDPRAFAGIVWAAAQRVLSILQETPEPQTAPPLTMDELCLTVGQTLKNRALLQARPEERVQIMSDLLHEGRYLLILDDVDETDDERVHAFLANVPVPTKVIITSRAQLSSHALPVPLSSLDTEDAIRLLQQDARMSGVTTLEKAGADELQRLTQQADALPLVLRWSVAQLRDSGQPVAWVIERLAQAGIQPLAEYCFKRSVQGLTEQQHRLFQAFALYPKPTRAEFAGAAAGSNGEELTRALARLVQLRLIRFNESSEQYQMMFIGRQYALAELLADDSFRDEATRRALQQMYELARDHGHSGNRAGNDFLETEIANVLWAAHQAFALQDWKMVLEFLDKLKDFLYLRGYWNESLQLGQWAYDAAQACASSEQPARSADERAWCAEQRAWSSLYPLTRIHFYQGNYDEAQQWGEHGLELFRQMGNEYGMAAAERLLGRVFLARGDFDHADSIFTDGLKKARKFNERDSHFNQQGDLLSSLAGLAELREQFDEAQRGYTEAKALFEKTNNQLGVAAMLRRLGSVAFGQKNYDEAERLFRESLALPHHSDWISHEAKARYALGLLREERGQFNEAQVLLLQAREKFESLTAAADLARTDAALIRVAAMTIYQQRQASQE